MRYSKMELTIIKDCKTMGVKNAVIASFLNKKEHAGKVVRTENGVRKVKNIEA
jgi:hypothetical protein